MENGEYVIYVRFKGRSPGRKLIVNSPNVLGAFSEEDATKLSGVSLNQLRLWDRNGLLPASYASQNRRQPYSRVYSFRDLVSLRVLNLLRNRHGVSVQHLKKVAERLSRFGEEKWTATTLYVLGKRVVFDDPESGERKEVVGGQRVFDIPLRAAISDTLEAIRRENARKGAEIGKVIKKKFVLNNQAVFEGTRVPITAVQQYVRRNFTNQAILSEFPDLTETDIEEARRLLDTDAA